MLTLPLHPQRLHPRLTHTARCQQRTGNRKSTRLNSSHTVISYAVFCLKKKKKDASYSETVIMDYLFELEQETAVDMLYNMCLIIIKMVSIFDVVVCYVNRRTSLRVGHF